MAKQKKLVLNEGNINDIDKEYDTLTKITFNDGAYTEIYKKFKPEKVDVMLNDFASFIQDYEKHGGSVNNDKEFVKYLYLFIVQHFSTLVQGLPSEFASRLNLLDKLTNNRYVLGLEEHFDKDELQYVYTTIFKKIEALQKMSEVDKELKNQMREKIESMELENEDIIKKIMLGEDVADEQAVH
ncbi:hypothetical protein [Paenibacillus medicaginis]|uniref:Uncharacterized protein n=1 Tax=Paenibacillus medicaginis TaxID=1470560 RepID=A0ABV5BUY8_9BACL